MKNFIKPFLVTAFAALAAFPVMAGGSKDSGAAAPAVPRDASAFEGTWVSDTYKETFFNQFEGEDVEIPSTFTFLIDEDGDAMVQSPLIHYHYEPIMYEVKGNTLVITISGDKGREEYAVFQITGNTLVRAVTENGRENRHVYTKRDE